MISYSKLLYKIIVSLSLLHRLVGKLPLLDASSFGVSHNRVFIFMLRTNYHTDACEIPCKPLGLSHKLIQKLASRELENVIRLARTSTTRLHVSE